jgi:hypothetical protein
MHESAFMVIRGAFALRFDSIDEKLKKYQKEYHLENIKNNFEKFQLFQNELTKNVEDGFFCC